MRIRYHITSDGKGLILDGTPVEKRPGEDLTLIFDAKCDSSCLFFGGKRYQMQGGVALIPYAGVSIFNELRLQCTKDGVTSTFGCEPIMERDGHLLGRDEHSGHYPELKHIAVALIKENEELAARIAALEKKCAELEYKLDGTDIFDLSE